MSKALIWVTDDELLALDGIASPENQAKVDVIKAARATMAAHPEMASGDAAFLSRVVAEATTAKVLIGYYKAIRHCDICDKYEPGHARAQRPALEVASASLAGGPRDGAALRQHGR